MDANGLFICLIAVGLTINYLILNSKVKNLEKEIKKDRLAKSFDFSSKKKNGKKI